MPQQRCVNCNKFIKNGSTTCPHCGAKQSNVSTDNQSDASIEDDVMNIADAEKSASSGYSSARGILAGAAIILILLLVFMAILGPAFRTPEPSTSSTEIESLSTDTPDSSTGNFDSSKSDSSNSYFHDSNNLNSPSYDSYGSDSSPYVDDKDTLGVELRDGSTVYQDGDGTYYYFNPDGSIEVTDGQGTVGIDTDLDGEFDSYSTDGGETWRDWD